MNLVRWSPRFPNRELVSFENDVNRLFDQLIGGVRAPLTSVFSPAVDVEEGGDSFTVRMDLPGLAQNDVKVSLTGDALTVRGERKHETTQAGKNAHRIERSFGAFERSFTFDTPVKSDGIKAQFRNGVLEITVPKADEAKVREIEVQVAS